MKRVLIVGCPGSGKTSFARAIKRKTNLPIIHLDAIYFDPRKEYSRDQELWQQKIRELAAEDRWIIEGFHVVAFMNYSDRADTIIFLDYSRRTVLWRLFKRHVLHHQKTAPEMPKGWEAVNDTSVSHWFFKIVLNFAKTYRTSLDKLMKPTAHKQRLKFKKPSQAVNYLVTLAEQL